MPQAEWFDRIMQPAMSTDPAWQVNTKVLAGFGYACDQDFSAAQRWRGFAASGSEAAFSRSYPQQQGLSASWHIKILPEAAGRKASDKPLLPCMTVTKGLTLSTQIVFLR